ncbi:uncharacterized protein LOC115883245 [Sitophilus oryzae]|uniref:Uncharacterized protein LOC115883245 n=1 Tax=Sitophilus oryzae TaxID=7048 RepID=A0A6J2Y3C5_SITOR|nr:uncharacterized protein LOC115883245 [Sitophilus oryzae]
MSQENDGAQENLLREHEARLKLINQHRSGSVNSLKKQATEMLQQSSSKFCKIETGQIVLVKIPDVDRGRLAPRNILAVLSEKDGLSQLGTSTGVLEKLDARNQWRTKPTVGFIIVFNNINLSIYQLIQNSVCRQIAAKESNSSQGFVRCNCRKQCGDKKCKCVMNKRKCNSKCHSSTSCRKK